ncbi:MBL fold metallo-hydrolase RNA specificity domain-containing protein [Actinokineospora xionganensis]|uniref:MBL fold metallo-hydrolase n=1 Tax=Actinokineospora xionganensis TaxID=2684470 RepID=A0ABR7KZH8_9PSEU|nr:MBL fold metallo-hydrolase [Actinokineospora xionganensis]MBC6445840.1 MBL fold metallo-hydrolase [Actinokineospora xionganensis]
MTAAPALSDHDSRLKVPPSIDFLGGVGTVTGSKFLVRSGDSRVLVDCGLFQGLAPLRRRNWQRPPVDVTELDAVVLTHAHLDHCGYLPVLVREGWRGPVYVTPGTAALVEIVLRDSAHLLMEEAAHANTHGWSKHRPALPLYDDRDAERALSCLRVVDFGTPTTIAEGVELEFGEAGHILGSAWARLELGGRSAVFSGDMGRQAHRLLAPPRARPECDVLVMESTYGAREHRDEGASDELAELITSTVAGGGSVLIPAFAVDRTEVLLIELAKLMRAGAIPEVPVLVDSPMALASLRVYRRAIGERWAEIRSDLAGGDPFAVPNLQELRTVEESMRANHPRMPSIVISASGMASGGRVLHHLTHLLPDRRNTVVIVGFAAAGTRARQLVDGATQLKIHGRYVPVRARVGVLEGFSAHADSDELVAWANSAASAPGTTFLVHGEPAASAELARRLGVELGWNAVVPRDGEHVVV